MDHALVIPEIITAQEKIPFAHSLRAVAVLMVLISHVFGTFWLHADVLAQMMNLPIIPETTFEAPGFVHALHSVRLFSWGAMGVALFFLISGFVIPFSLERHGIRGFLLGRLCRILPTYWVGFTVGLLAVWLMARSLPPTLATEHGWLHWLPGFYPHLQTPMVDGVIWTLNVEMRYYALMALLFWLTRRSLPRVLLVLTAAGLLLAMLLQVPVLDVHWRNSAFWMSGLYYFRYFLFMSAGLAVHLYHRGAFSGQQAAGIGALLLLSFWSIWRSMPAIDGAPVSSYALMAGLFMLAYYFRQSPIFRMRLLNFIATISYSIYAIHAMLGFSVYLWLRQHGVGQGFCLVLVPIVVFGAAYLLWYAIELPSHRLAQKIARRTDASASSLPPVSS